MRLLFAKSRWELPECELGEFLARIKDAGFDAAELYLPGVTESDETVRRMHADAGLELVAQIVTTGESPAAHAESLRRLYARALSCGAVRVNCHTGTDWFPFADNIRIFEAALGLESEGPGICPETHRGRAWHIHARVGCAQAPQVADARAPEFAPQLATLLGLWRRVLQARASDGADFVAITPEFGPPPYQPAAPSTGRALADPWLVNLWIRDYLRSALAAFV